ncbi:MAG: TonB-dependent receptor, partial [Bdellovibrionales bacterium]|nr:TonB-dependent receptor [Bdellovibrionales bacterium]
LRGSQSTLYGSDAIGGVIHITTKKGSPVTEVAVSAQGGSFETFVEQVEVRTGAQGGEVSLGFSREDSGSFSAADKRVGNSEEDRYERTSFSFQGGIHPFNELDLNVVFRHNDSEADIDNFGGTGGDDPNRVFDNRETFFRTEGVVRLFDGALKQIYGVALTNHNFQDDNDPDIAHPLDIQRSEYSGKLIKWDLQNIYTHSPATRFIFGLETEQETASSNFFSDGAFGPYSSNFGPADARTNGYYADLFLEASPWLASSFGVRLDDHSRTGNEVTFRIAPVVTIAESGTRFLGAVSTGYKSPSLFQLYSSYGNPLLEAEESTSWEVGVEQDLFDEVLTIGGTYFRNDIDRLVTFNSGTFVFENINKANIEGFEFFARANVVQGLDLSVDFTLLDTEDESTKESLLRRAKSQLSSSLHYTFFDQRASLQARVRYVGERDDQNYNVFPAQRVTLSGYTLLDLLATYHVTEAISLFARVENLFDKDYQEVFGYGTAGVAGYGGVKVKI